MSRGILAGSGRSRISGRSIAFASGTFLGAAGFTAVVRQSIGAASDLNEQMNKTQVVFGANSGKRGRWSETTAKGLGIARDQALAFAGTFGNLFVPMGIARDRAADMSTSLVKLAADMASFNNANPEEVLQAMQSGLSGEIEPLGATGSSSTRRGSRRRRSGSGWSAATVDQGKVADATTKLDIAQAKLTDGPREVRAAHDAGRVGDACRVEGAQASSRRRRGLHGRVDQRRRRRRRPTAIILRRTRRSSRATSRAHPAASRTRPGSCAPTSPTSRRSSARRCCRRC
jgi:hypothetical protein